MERPLVQVVSAKFEYEEVCYKCSVQNWFHNPEAFFHHNQKLLLKMRCDDICAEL